MNNNSNSQFLRTREEIAKWLDKYHIKNYTINDDLSVDVNGDVNISSKNLKAIPVNFRKVTGSFYCYDNELTSLIGSPETVDKSFCCNNNKLINLVDSPKSVSGDFYCFENKLISLVGAPKTVWAINCANNQLTSLAGSPKIVDGYFSCIGNKLISLMELTNCNFKKCFYFNIDKKDFKQKELIPLLEEYYNSKYKYYELTNRQFQDTIKPQIEKEILKQKVMKNKNNTNVKKVLI